MTVTIVGTNHRQGISKKDQKPYDFYEFHFLCKSPDVVGDCVDTQAVNPDQFPAASEVTCGSRCIFEYNKAGRLVDFSIVSDASVPQRSAVKLGSKE